MTILYLHGLGSNGQSSTVKGLNAEGLEIIAPDYKPHQFDESLALLRDIISTSNISFLAGTSMGAYYALRLHMETGLPVCAVNPCFEPDVYLRKYLNEPAIDYANDGLIEITTELLSQFETLTLINSEKLTIIIGQNDDVIPTEYQESYCTARQIPWLNTDWGHRIVDPHFLAEIIKIRS
jgi:predicted esterase YcpF (UPF0227 family)